MLVLMNTHMLKKIIFNVVLIIKDFEKHFRIKSSAIKTCDWLKYKKTISSSYDLRKMFLKRKYPVKLLNSIFKTFHAS